MERWFARGVLLFEQLTTVLLALVALLGLVAFFYAIFVDFSLGKKSVTEWVDFALLLFVIIELMRIALAYLRERDLLPIVFEAVMVAIARKLVVFDTEQPDFLTKAIALAVLVTATAVAWAILLHARAIKREGPSQ